MDLFESLIEPAAGLSVTSTGPHAYGGLPCLPDDTPWPAYAGTPMVLLAHLDCADLAGLLQQTWTLPRSGSLFFFHEETFLGGLATSQPDGPDHDDGCSVLHVPAGLPPRAAPAGVRTVPALPLAARRVGSIPPYDALALRDAFTNDPVAAMNARDAAEDTLGRPPRHQVLGWSRDAFLHLPGLRPLLQLEAEQGTAWGEVVNVSFWLPESDLAAGHLTNARRYLETA